MATTTGQAYYSSDDSGVLSGTSITYGFDTLSENDIQVVGIRTAVNPDTRHPLTKGVHFNVDLETKTVTVVGAASWSALTTFSSNSVDTIRIYRSTTTQPIVDFTNGGVLSESELDSSYKQALFACQEVSENASGIETIGIQSINGSALQDSSVTGAKLASYTITQSNMYYDSVGSTQLINASVTNPKLAADCVDTDNLIDGSVSYDKVERPTKSQVESQSGNGILTPDVLKYSPFSPRCYGTVDFVAGTNLYSGTYNVDTTTNPQTSQNQRTITFDTPLSDANYVVMAIRYKDDLNAAGNSMVIYNKTTTSFAIRCGDPESTGDKIDFVVFGSTLSS